MVWAPSICLYSFNTIIVLTEKKNQQLSQLSHMTWILQRNYNFLTWLGFYEEIIKSCMTFVGSIHPMEGSWCMRVVFLKGKFNIAIANVSKSDSSQQMRLLWYFSRSGRTEFLITMSSTWKRLGLSLYWNIYCVILLFFSWRAKYFVFLVLFIYLF